MDAYTFVQTEPGLASHVMTGLVESGSANRAVLVTGEFDVIARIDDISWDDLATRVLEGAQRLPGVVRTKTAVALTAEAIGFVIPPIPMPFRGMPVRGEPREALVLATYGDEASPVTAEAIAGLKGIKGMTHLTGKHDLMIQVSGRDLAHVARRVAEIHMVPGVATTETMLILAMTPREKGRSK